MIAYILRRFLLVAPTLIGILIIAFLAGRIGGVSPAVLMFPKASPDKIAELEKENGWDKPLSTQFVRYLGQLARFDLGKNYIVSSHPVLTELKSRFPATIELSFAAMLIALLVGVPVGVLAAVKHGRWFDYLSMTTALAGISVPIFWLAMMMIMAVGDWLPFDGRLNKTLIEVHDFKPVTHFMLIDTALAGNWALFKSACLCLVLPSIALATIPMAVIARITRAAMLETLGEDYVRTARAKGLSQFKVVVKHAFKNALPQINTAAGLQIGMLLSGAILTESIFNWNGLGTYVLNCAQNRDYNGTQGTVLLLALIFVVVNLLVDISYVLFDPRVRLD